MRWLVVFGVMVAGVAALRRARIGRSERELGLQSGAGGVDGARSVMPAGDPPIVRA